MKKGFVIGFCLTVTAALAAIGLLTGTVDPFFHYHAPDTETYFYPLNNQRSQNDGIIRRFDYQGLITGTSMTENFKTSEAEALFGVSFIKVPYSGGSYCEIDGAIASAAARRPDLQYVIRGLDMAKFFDDKDQMRTDLGAFPTYLYDGDPFNDVEYLFNRDVLFTRIRPMIQERRSPDHTPGITSFDAYSNWMKKYSFGPGTLYPKGLTPGEPAASRPLTEEDAEWIRANIRQNVTALAERYPDITFYYFFPPYSAAWWYDQQIRGNLDRQIGAERIVIEEILACDNIRLFSFNCLFDITTDLNHYKDTTHYGEWVNSLMLRYMREDTCRLTRDNYDGYLDRERAFYGGFDYSLLTRGEDYRNDYYAAALLRREIAGVEPCPVDLQGSGAELSRAEIRPDQYDGQAGLTCTGSLSRSWEDGPSVTEWLRDTEYVGAKIPLPDLTPYSYLVFYGKKDRDHGQPAVRLYDQTGEAVAFLDASYRNLDGEWRQYLVDVSGIDGPCTLILNGGYTDSTGSPASQFTFSGLTLY